MTEPNPTLTTDVNVIITADNAYGFGYGTETRLLNYEGGVENPDADDIFACPIGVGPEEYLVPAANANAGGYLYSPVSPEGADLYGSICTHPQRLGAGWWMCNLS